MGLPKPPFGTHRGCKQGCKHTCHISTTDVTTRPFAVVYEDDDLPTTSTTSKTSKAVTKLGPDNALFVQCHASLYARSKDLLAFLRRQRSNLQSLSHKRVYHQKTLLSISNPKDTPAPPRTKGLASRLAKDFLGVLHSFLFQVVPCYIPKSGNFRT